MIGVILWSDPAEQKAVIWCEDHGDLAFVSCPQGTIDAATFVDVGDVVEFDLIAQRSTRHADNVRVLSEARGAPLVAELRATQQNAPSSTAEVIPFRFDPPARKDAPVANPVQRRG